MNPSASATPPAPPLELELKLGCTPATAQQLVPHLDALCGHPGTLRVLQNTYYDTPTATLQARKIALRLRRQDDVWLQTVKCASDNSGGLSQRPEWETPYRGSFDFSPIEDVTIQTLLTEHGATLVPILQTDFNRLCWDYHAGEAHIELMLDRGHITAGERATAICELELELIHGSADDLFALALQLAREFALFPSPLSKAARGARLRHPVSEAPADSTDACFRQLCMQLPANAPSTAVPVETLMASLQALSEKLPPPQRERLHALQQGMSAEALFASPPFGLWLLQLEQQCYRGEMR